MSNADIEMQAGHWVLKREEGGLSAQDRSALEAWLVADSRHRAAYVRLNTAWQFSTGLKRWRSASAPVNPDLLLPHVPAQGASRWPWVLAVAATLGAVVVGLFIGLPETYSTRIGGYQRVVLDDGTVMQLNTDSKARVKFNAAERKVQLLRGEAHFDIAKDPGRPFEVEAGSTVVRAVGTAFSVRLRGPERVDVMVTQGRVLVEEPDSPGMPASAGESAEATSQGLRLRKVAPENLEHRLAWQAGRLNFQQEPLAVVVAEFNRYNRRRIELADPALSGLEVHGNFKATDLSSFIAAIRTTLKVRVEEAPDAIRIYAD